MSDPPPASSPPPPPPPSPPGPSPLPPPEGGPGRGADDLPSPPPGHAGPPGHATARERAAENLEAAAAWLREQARQLDPKTLALDARAALFSVPVLFRRISLRRLVRHKLRTGITLFGIGLGVAMLVAVSLLNRTIIESFQGSLESVSGKATLQVAAGAAGIAQKYLAVVEGVPGVRAAAPVLECIAAVEGADGATITVLGIDPQREAAVRGYKLDTAQVRNPLEFVLRPDALLLSREFAERWDLRLDQKVTLVPGGTPVVATIVGLLAPEGPAKAFAGHVAVMNLPAAQRAFRRVGKLDRIDVVTAPEETAAVAERLRDALAGACRVEAPDLSRQRVETMVRSFQGGMSLTSLIGVFVGMFLIYNTMTISIVQRRGEIGVLRCLGARRNEIMMMIGAESILFGAVGAGLGAVAGVFLARSAVSVVGATVNAFYVRINMDRLSVTPELVVLCMLVGVAAAGASAFLPAREAARISPLEALGRGGGDLQHPLETLAFQVLGLLGIPFSAAIMVLAPFPEPVYNGYLGIGLMLLAFSCLAPMATQGTAWLLRRTVLPLFGIEGRIAHDNVLRGLRRTAVTVGALMISVASISTYGVYLHSFKTGVDTWVEQSIRADLFVCAGSSLPGPSSIPVPQEVLDYVEHRPEYKTILPARITKYDYQGTKVGFIALSLPKFIGENRVLLHEGSAAELASLAADPGDRILVSQNFATRFGSRLHETLYLDTPAGRKGFLVAGIHVDYTSDQGVIIIDRDVYLKHWEDPRLDIIDVFLQPGADLDAARADLLKEFGTRYRIFTLSNRELRREVESIIDQSFAVSYALEFVALVVAVLGILNTLLANVLDRTREIGILRAIGSLRGQVRRMVLIEAGLIAAAACLLGVGAGLVLGWFTVTTVNVQATGWLIPFHVPGWRLTWQVLVIFGAALAAGGYPSGRAARLNIVEALEYE